MEKKRFQVFVSSTFEDLREERQAAVEAILKAGHIPAGMELFTAGSESQLVVIREWIRTSDIYMLILGGRYGSIEPTSGLSYTEVEFSYALELGKPFFSVVISDAGRDAKAKVLGAKALELTNGSKYEAFKGKVVARMCAFFDSPKDVKLAVFETLPQLASAEGLVGWVSGSEVTPSADIANELARALQENRRLREAVSDLEVRLESARGGVASYDELYSLLESEEILVPKSVSPNSGGKTFSLLTVALTFVDNLALGVDSSAGASDVEKFLMWQIAPRLIALDLAESAKVPPSVMWQRIKLSKKGIEFLTRVRVQRDKDKQTIDATTNASLGPKRLGELEKSN